MTAVLNETHAPDGVVAAVEPDGQRSMLARIAALIGAFSDDRALSLDDLTRRTGLPRSTVYRLAEQLRAVGWIERASSGYRIGLRLFEVGGMASIAAKLRAQAGVWLFQAHQQSGQTVHLGVLDGDEVVYIDKVSPPRVDIPTRVGGRFPAHRTALGRALLAARPVEEWPALIAGCPEVDAHALRAILERTRENGIATDLNEAVEGLACVAAPILMPSGVIGAISVTGPSRAYRATFQRNAGIVRLAAEGVATRAVPLAVSNPGAHSGSARPPHRP